MSTETGDILLAAAGRGDAAAVVKLLERHHGDVRAYVERHLPVEVRAGMDPQDIVQDVHFEVFRRVGTFRGESDEMFLRWVLTIARHRIVDVIRNSRASKRGGGLRVDNEASPNGEDGSVVALLTDLKAYLRTPSQSVLSRELVGVVATCMDKLEPEHREALRMRYLDELPMEDVAQRMAKTKGAVQMICHRALRAMRAEVSRLLGAGNG